MDTRGPAEAQPARSGGRLCAVIDFGGVGVGDPAADVIAAWSVFGHTERADVSRCPRRRRRHMEPGARLRAPPGGHDHPVLRRDEPRVCRAGEAHRRGSPRRHQRLYSGRTLGVPYGRKQRAHKARRDAGREEQQSDARRQVVRIAREPALRSRSPPGIADGRCAVWTYTPASGPAWAGGRDRGNVDFAAARSS